MIELKGFLLPMFYLLLVVSFTFLGALIPVFWIALSCVKFKIASTLIPLSIG